jgi:CheY-like chemotaxis protein
MKRLLFVDDEAMVLSGLRRSLHGMRNLWDMQFVESAAAALQALEKERYDAIISDMRMPLMDGADLLDQVKERYPDVVRMILSGQSSREGGVPVDFSSAPVSFETLRPPGVVEPVEPGVRHARSAGESVAEDDDRTSAFHPQFADSL